MGDWRKDRFLDEFLVTHQNQNDVGEDSDTHTDEKHLEDGLENCTDLYLFSADDDTLVSYLSGELFSNTSETSTTTTSTSKNGPSVELEFESQVPVKSTKSSSRPQVETKVIELEDDTVEDCIDLSHLAASDDDSLHSNGLHKTKRCMDTTVEEKTTGRTSPLGYHDLQPNAQMELDTSQLIEPNTHTDEIEDGINSVSDRSTPPERQFRFVTEHSPKSKRGTCNSKGAIAARERRLKNKQHLTLMEESMKKLSKENEQLKKRDGEKTQQIEQLREEIRFLKHVVANRSTLSTLLENISTANGHRLACSLQPGAAEPDENCESGNNNSKISTAICEKRKHADSVLVGGESSPEVTSSPKRRCTTSSNVLQPISLISRRSQSGHSRLQDTIVALNSDVFENRAGRPTSPSLTSGRRRRVDGTPLAASAQKTDGAGREGPQDLDVSPGDLDGMTEDDIGGICLHVQGDSVSIELCATCNHNAVKSLKICQ